MKQFHINVAKILEQHNINLTDNIPFNDCTISDVIDYLSKHSNRNIMLENIVNKIMLHKSNNLNVLSAFDDEARLLKKYKK